MNHTEQVWFILNKYYLMISKKFIRPLEYESYFRSMILKEKRILKHTFYYDYYFLSMIHTSNYETLVRQRYCSRIFLCII